ncbi:MAG TPA: hypothetical protein VLW05_00395 [Gaiellaceae bacterium]|nr:hypothetical protein [Gaiellaceae bacterium]
MSPRELYTMQRRGTRSVPALLLALPLLGIARLFPETGFGLWLRLAAATLVLLLPGRLVARALGRRGSPAAVTWSVALVAGALALTFAVHSSLNLTLGLVLGAGAVALPFSLRIKPEPAPRGRGLVALAGIGLGAGLWGIEGIVHGDAIFHLGRIRKLLDFDSLTLRTVDEFKDGGLHPGYAFPLWHGWLALVARLGGVDPTSVILHESSILVPIACVVAFETGIIVFASVWLGLAGLLAQVTLIGLAPGGGGSYTTLELPGTTARQILVPATIALFFQFVRGPSWALAATVAASGMVLAFVHPTYAMFVAIPLGGFALARLLVTRGDLRRSVGALAAFTVPVLLVFAWLAPIVGETLAHNPGPLERTAELKHFRPDLVIHSLTSFHLAAAVVSRTGAIAVAALVLTPLAALAARRRWSAFVLGGTLVVLVLELSAFLFPRFSDLVSLSQSRRAAGFVPFAFALAGGAAVLARAAGVFLLPIALAAGIALQLAFPGDFGLSITGGGPAAVTWIALVGSAAGLVAMPFLARSRRFGRFELAGPVAAGAVALFVLPVAVHGFTHWSTQAATDPYALSPGVVRYLRTEVPKGSIVFADLETSYRISGYVPVYVSAGPQAHVANTRANRPAARARDVRAFLRTADLAIPRRYHAGWLVLRDDEGIRRFERQGLKPVYHDGSFTVFELGTPRTIGP